MNKVRCIRLRRVICIAVVATLCLGLLGIPTYAADDASARDWDLTFLFANKEAAIQAIESCKQPIHALSKLASNIDTISSVKKYLDACEEINRTLWRVDCYIRALSSIDRTNTEAMELQRMLQSYSMALSSTNTIAFIQIKDKPDDFWNKLLSSSSLAPYRNQLCRIKNSLQHQPSVDAESTIEALSLSFDPYDAYSKLVYGDMDWLKVTLSNGKTVTVDENTVLKFLLAEKDQQKRVEIHEALLGAYARHQNALAQTLNILIKTNVTLAALKNYDSSLQSALDANEIPVATYDALMQSAKQALPAHHRYIKLLKDHFGLDQVYNSDLYLPLGNGIDTTYTYDEAREILKKALAPLGSDYVAMIDRAFEERWIDAYPKASKQSGAYSMSAPDHAIVLINYMDDYKSLSTLAHELGHAINQTMSLQAQETLYNSNPSTFVTEVASILNQLLLSDYMIKNATTDAERLAFLNEEAQLFNGVFFRQSFFAAFEEDIYHIVEDGGVLHPEKLAKLWKGLIQEFYGPDFTALDADAYGWSRIPHFYYHFYVYQYATSLSYACNIVDDIASGDADAVQNYLDFLAAGDSMSTADIFQIVGIDIASPDMTEALTERYGDTLDEIQVLLEK